MSTIPQLTVGIIDAPDLAYALENLGVQVIGGGDFRDAAQAIRLHERIVPVIAHDRGRAGFRGWIDKQRSLGSAVVTLRLGVPELTTDIPLPTTLAAILDAAGLPALPERYGQLKVEADASLPQLNGAPSSAAYMRAPQTPTRAPAEPPGPEIPQQPTEPPTTTEENRAMSEFNVTPDQQNPFAQQLPPGFPTPPQPVPTVAHQNYGNTGLPQDAAAQNPFPGIPAAQAPAAPAPNPFAQQLPPQPTYLEQPIAQPYPQQPFAQQQPVPPAQPQAPGFPAAAPQPFAQQPAAPAQAPNPFVQVEQPQQAQPFPAAGFPQQFPPAAPATDAAAQQPVFAPYGDPQPQQVFQPEPQQPVYQPEPVYAHPEPQVAPPSFLPAQPYAQPEQFPAPAQQVPFGVPAAEPAYPAEPAAPAFAQPEPAYPAQAYEPEAAYEPEQVIIADPATEQPQFGVPAAELAPAPALAPAAAFPQVGGFGSPGFVVGLDDPARAFPEIQDVRDEDLRAQILVSFGAKGGVGKTTCAVLMAQRAAAANMRVVVVDMNRGQGNIRSYLRLDNPNLPTVYNAAVTGRAQDALISPRLLRENRDPKLPGLGFAVVMSPPAALADPRIVTAGVYHKVIRFIQSQADLVIIDTQIVEAKDTSGLIDRVLTPLLQQGAWGLGVSDMSRPGRQDLLVRTKEFIGQGADRERLMLMVNKAPQFGAAEQAEINETFAQYSAFLGAAGEDPELASAMNAGSFDVQNSTLRPILDSALYRVTGNDAFLGDEPTRKRGGLFGRRR